MEARLSVARCWARWLLSLSYDASRIAWVTLLLFAVARWAGAESWTELPPIPDANGVAGAFAGVSGGALLVAGGANFPGKKPWEGGEKVWHDAVYALPERGTEWVQAGHLPQPLGYGVSVSHGGGVVCAGGSDAKGHHAEVFRLTWEADVLSVVPLPALPQPLANGCGALVGDVLYVAGGQASPSSQIALDSVYRMDLSADSPRWEAVASIPGSGRILAVAAGFDGAFWVVGGASLQAGSDGKPKRTYLRDAWRLNAGHGWRRMADLPRAVVAAPSPAPALADGYLLLGGDDGTQVDSAPEAHRGFSARSLRYDKKSGAWHEAGQLPAPRVTAPCVPWAGGWVIPSGEMRPGVRSPEVWHLVLDRKDG